MKNSNVFVFFIAFTFVFAFLTIIFASVGFSKVPNYEPEILNNTKNANTLEKILCWVSLSLFVLGLVSLILLKSVIRNSFISN